MCLESTHTTTCVGTCASHMCRTHTSSCMCTPFTHSSTCIHTPHTQLPQLLSQHRCLSSVPEPEHPTASPVGSLGSSPSSPRLSECYSRHSKNRHGGTPQPPKRHRKSRWKVPEAWESTDQGSCCIPSGDPSPGGRLISHALSKDTTAPPPRAKGPQRWEAGAMFTWGGRLVQEQTAGPLPTFTLQLRQC